MIVQPPQPPAEIQKAPPQGVSSFHLSNGLLVRLFEDHERPSIRMSLRVCFDESGAAADHKGLLGLLANMMLKGIQQGDRAASSTRHLSDLPIRTDAKWDSRYLQINLDSPSETMESAFERLATWIVNPTLDEKTLEQLRAQFRTAPLGMLERWTAQTAFKLGLENQTPLPLPTELMLNRANTTDLNKLHHNCVLPWQAELTVVGDIDKDQLEKIASQVFASWTAAPGKHDQVKPVSPRTWVSTTITETPLAAVGLILGGDTEDARVIGQLLSIRIDALARSLDSGRLVLNFDTGQSKGLWQVSVGVPPKQRPEKVLAELDQWLESLATKVPSENDLATAKYQWQAWRRSLLLHPADRLSVLAAGSHPDESLAAKVQAISLSRFQEAWRACTERKARNLLVLGADEQSIKAIKEMGYASPIVVRVVR
jgi:predicted Zn-dependent peptidase